MLVNTRVLVTDSVTNIAASRAGSATEVSEKLNSRTSRQAATIIATVLRTMNQLRAANTFDVAERRHQQGAAGRVEVVRVHLVEVLVVDVHAAPEVRTARYTGPSRR